MQPKNITPFQALLRSIGMIIQAAPFELRLLILLTLISGAGPSITLFLNKIIIDRASALIGQGATTIQGTPPCEVGVCLNFVNTIDSLLQEPVWLWSIGGVILLNLLTDSIHTLTNFVLTSLRDRVQGFVQEKVLDKVANFEDIALFETPELLNLVQLSEQGVQRLQQLSLILITSLNGFFAFIPAVIISGSIAWWIPLILFISATPSIYVELKYQKRSWKVEKTQAGIVREMNLYKNVLTTPVYAKEIRLFRLQTFLLERWQTLFRQMFRAMQRIRRKGTFMVIAWSMLSGLGAALPYVYVVMGSLGGIYTLGDLALYAGLILQVRQSLYLLINSGSDLYDVALGTSPIFQLLALKPKLKRALPLTSNFTGEQTNRKFSENVGTNQAFQELREIQIKNLSFSYPGGSKKILERINLTIQRNEMIALVGENGAGKTTLAKLLCRLYDPDSGEILWNGQDLRQLNLDELYGRISVVMQDYAKFPTTVRENVSFGCLPYLDNDLAIKQALREAGISQVIERLPQGLETLLGKQLERGRELSGGQWQRMAIARSLIRLSSAELLIFDEPTAALDPKTEHEIYQIFRTIAAHKITVVVSHRLALAKLANRIVVLENGKILEMGTHEELMARGGQYNLMFTRQACSYQ